MDKVINISEKIKSSLALTQEQGDIIYTEVKECFENGQSVILDFSEVTNIIAAFLHHAIGQLYNNYTGEYIEIHLELKGFAPTKNYVLNAVINNAKKYYGK